MKYLGVDYGKSKVGLALSEGQLATPWKVIRANRLEVSLDQIQQIIRAESIDQVVVGLADSGQARKIAQTLIAGLKKQGIKTATVDEHLSTQQAKRELMSLGGSRKSRQKKEDSMAAAIILQNYLDSLQ